MSTKEVGRAENTAVSKVQVEEVGAEQKKERSKHNQKNDKWDELF